MNRLLVLVAVLLIGVGVGFGQDMEGKSIEELIKDLKNEDEDVREAAAEALGKIGVEAAVPALIEALRDEEDARVCISVEFALVGIGGAAVPALSEALKDENEKVRRSAADALGLIGEDAKAAVPALIEVLKDEDANVRHCAAFALGKIGVDAKAAVPALMEALKKDEYEYGRRSAAEALGKIGVDAKAAVPALIEALRDEDEDGRRSAGRALGKIGVEAAVPALMEALKDDKDMQVRIVAAEALGKIGVEAAVPALIEALRDEEDANVRHSAAVALGQIGPEAKAAVPALMEALKDDKEMQIRSLAAYALGRIGPEAKAAVPALIEALESADADVRVSAAATLIEIGVEAKEVVPALIEVLKDADGFFRNLAAEVLARFGEKTQLKMRTLNRTGLEEHISVLRKARRHLIDGDIRWRVYVGRIDASINALERELQSRFSKKVEDTIRGWNKRKWPWLVVAYAGLFVSWSTVLSVWPRGILVVNDFLKQLPEGKIKSPVEMTLSVRHLLVVGFFNHHCRVLDAWVKKRRLGNARENFSGIATVADRRFHVSIPVILNNEVVADFSAEELQATFRRKERTCVLIQGQGGAGKTSLACQLGTWATESHKSKRLARHPMLPVLIEDELGDGGLVEEARNGLQNLIGQPTPVDPELFTQLIRKKRVLVIVDGLSEMSETTRNQIQAKDPDFPAALIVTSRIEEKQLGNKTTLQPSLLKGNRVSSFMESYLRQQKKGDLFEDDEEYFDACRRLSQMVGEREITVLLAKLYIDQIVKLKEESLAGSMPESIPDLMLRYVNELHPKGTDVGEIRRSQEDAKTVAWECLKEMFYPATAERETVIKELGGEDAEARVDVLETKLRIIRTEGTRYNRVRFVLDPLAEYLAGLRLVERYKGNGQHWRSFLKRAEEKPPEKIQGFLLAVRDCCLASESKVPDFVDDELGKRGGLDPEAVQRFRSKLRVKRLTGELRVPEAEDRRHAAQALGRVGPEAKAAVPALMEALKDEDVFVRGFAAEALKEIGPEAKAAVPALMEALKDEDVDVRRSAGRALGFIGDAAVPALIEVLGDEDVDVRRSAGRVLGEIGPEAKAAVPALMEALKDEDVDVRRSAGRALARIGAEAKEAVPALMEALEDDKEMQVRSLAAYALGSIGAEAKAAVPALSEALKDKDEDEGVCHTAAEALGRIGAEAKAAVPALSEALKDEESRVRSLAAGALRWIGDAAVPALMEALKDEDEGVRSSASRALRGIGDAAVPALSEALKDEDVDVRISAGRVLARIGAEAKAAVPALIEALKDEDGDVRYSAAEALVRIGAEAKAAVPALIEALKDEDARVRSSASRALRGIGDAAVPALSEALKDEDSRVRSSVARVLARVNVPPVQSHPK